MDFILKSKVKHYTKAILKGLKIASISILFILTIIAIKYVPVYEVTYNGEVLGYVKSKSEIEKILEEEVLISDEPSAIDTYLNSDIAYELKLANIENTNEQEIIEKLSSDTTTMYRIYAINVGENTESYVSTWEEAEEVINKMQQEYANDIDVNITVTEKYTEKLEEVGVAELAEAEASIDTSLRKIVDEKERIAKATCNGVYLAVKPVSGTITSRYGVVESVRDHAHSGLDIAAPEGTKIKAAAEGTVSYSGWMGGYGYLIIIDHANGVQTYYGHCSKLYASVGDEVEPGDVIAAVGSTGNSTGNHLHFEIRIDGVSQNPQKYIYN